MQPYLTENGKAIPLSECNYEQTEKLYDFLSSKVEAAYACRSSGYDQIQTMLDMVQQRLDMFESGQLKREDEKKKSFKGLRVEDEDDNKDFF